jgi:hypothetical protein
MQKPDWAEINNIAVKYIFTLLRRDLAVKPEKRKTGQDINDTNR